MSEEITNTYQSDRSIVYKEVDGPDLQLYFFSSKEQEQKPRPAIIFFFGGGWIKGSPAQFSQQALYFKSRGMTAVLADYRTRESHGTTPLECVEDAMSAVRFLRKHAPELQINPNQIVASGGSAGGHLAAATATLKSLSDDSSESDVSPVPNALVSRPK